VNIMELKTNGPVKVGFWMVWVMLNDTF